MEPSSGQTGSTAIEVVDLCSSDDDERTEFADCGSRRKEKRIRNIEGDEENIHAKTQWRVARHNPGAPTLSSEVQECSYEPMLFLNGDMSGDDAVLTEGLPLLLRGLMSHLVRTCEGKEPRASKAPSKHVHTRGTGLAISLSTLCHIQQKDNWSCGFRNLQMMLTALLPALSTGHSFFERMADSVVGDGAFAIPSILQLQRLLERCWQDGFDARGAHHYRNRIVGKVSKIGAVEVANALAYAGIDSTVVQFVKCRESRALLPGFCDSYFSRKFGRECCSFCGSNTFPQSNGPKSTTLSKQALQIATFNCTADVSCPCPVLPLYLQWEGHSVTVVGVERNASARATNLLVFDPMKVGSRVQDGLVKNQLAYLRLPCSRLAGKDCQVVVCTTAPLASFQMENMKPEMSAVTAAERSVLRSICR